mgnify:CR=1 FL=1
MEKTLGVVVKRVKGGINFRVLTDSQNIPGVYKMFGWMQGQGKTEAGEFLAHIIEDRARQLMNKC